METGGNPTIIPSVSPGVIAERRAPGVQKRSDNRDGGTPDTENPSNTTLTTEQLHQLANDLNDHIHILNTKVSFFIDENTGNAVIRISDRETDEVLREIPTQEMLKLASKLAEVIGIIVDRKA